MKSLESLREEQQRLVLPGFTERDALTLGRILVGLAEAGDLPVVINIRNANRTFFHAALPGAAANNDNWARRKSNTALQFGLASLHVGEKNRAKGQSLADQGYALNDFADHGGAVPIVVSGVGMVAVATVSGLPQLDDHALVVQGIAQMLASLPVAL